MAHYEISLGISLKSSLYVTAHFINHDVDTSFRLTKEKLYRFLQFHCPDFHRYASACRRYTFHELCTFLVHQDQDKYSSLPFFVSVHPVNFPPIY